MDSDSTVPQRHVANETQDALSWHDESSQHELRTLYNPRVRVAVTYRHGPCATDQYTGIPPSEPADCRGPGARVSPMFQA